MNLICKHVDAMEGYVPGEQPHFPGMVKLNTNENPYPPSPKVGEALSKVDLSKLRLYPDPVFTKVRATIAAMHGCAPENVFVGNGSDEILALVTRAFVESDGTLGYFEPTYSLYKVLAQIRDVKNKPFALNDDLTCATPPDDWSDVFIWTNPNAPTSLQAPLEQLAAFAKSYRGVLLIDEAYADFAPFNCMTLATSSENTNTLVMRTLSKSYSLAGVRFGYCVGPQPLIDALMKIKDSYNMDMLAQVAGQAALEDTATMRAHTRAILATRERLARTLRDSGWQVLDSATNFLFAAPPASGETASDIFKRLRDAHIYLRYFPGPKTGNFLRITIGTDEEIDKLLAQLI